MLTLLPTPIGNIDDITIRTIKEIENSNLILCEDTRVTKQLLNILKDRFNLKIPDANILSFHEHNGKARLNQIKDALKTKNVVYMSDAGMPVISDPGQLLVEYCQKENIPYNILPGASVAPLIYAASGFRSGKFFFYGFLPNRGKERLDELKKVCSSGMDTIIYESPHRIIKLLEQISQIDNTREVFVAKELTKKYQKFYKGSAIDILEKLNKDIIKGEWALVIEGKTIQKESLNLDEILSLEIPPKAKAKIVSKLTGKSIKECYNQLLNI
jgi:16S rRNA (cytidine1402-2'-O)-methyltransferase